MNRALPLIAEFKAQHPNERVTYLCSMYKAD
jgi:hypothetical protein